MSETFEEDILEFQSIEILRKKNKQLKAELEAARKEIYEWENREASICPEDFGFEDVIKQLKAELAAAKIDVK